MKRLLLTGLLLHDAYGVQACEVLRVYNWNLYIEPQMLREFEQR